jgi:hypothetical protein
MLPGCCGWGVGGDVSGHPVKASSIVNADNATSDGRLMNTLPTRASCMIPPCRLGKGIPLVHRLPNTPNQEIDASLRSTVFTNLETGIQSADERTYRKHERLKASSNNRWDSFFLFRRVTDLHHQIRTDLTRVVENVR